MNPHRFFFIVFIFFGVVSCTPQEPEARTDALGKVTVSFGVEGPVTKGFVTGEADAIESLELLVFRRIGGALDTRVRTTSSKVISASVTEGTQLDWYLVANVPDNVISGFRNREAFLQSVTRLDQVTQSAMPMYASGSGVFTGTDHCIHTALKRYACKVRVEKISVDWQEALPCRLEKVILINAVGSTPWSGIPAAGDVWYNKVGADYSLGSDVRSMLVWDDGADIDSQEAVSVDAELYTMPNPLTESAYGLPWTPRCTRLALEIVSDGMSNWYNVDIPAMEGNSLYLIKNVVIKGPGSSGPDMELVRNGIESEITLRPWGTEESEVDFNS